MINFRPGEGTKTVYGTGGARFIKDTYVPPFNPPQSTPVEEVIEEINLEENELQRTQVEQTEISSGSEHTREFSTGDKQDPSRKPRV
jgi:hypothetical protein